MKNAARPVRPRDGSARSGPAGDRAPAPIRRPTRILRGAGLTARVRPWPGTTDVAHLVTLEQQAAPPSALLRSWLNDLRAEGYTAVRTGATSPSHRAPYQALDFRPVQVLALLRAKLDELPPRAPSPAEVKLRRGRASELGVLSAVDIDAFPPGWGLDADAIDEACTATPSYRIRVAVDHHGGPIGYAVSGRSSRSSFLQRLAVRPGAQGRGVGRALVDDSLTWARRWRCHSMVVNTQHDNEAALGLYQRAGFRLLPDDLVVFERSLDAPL